MISAKIYKSVTDIDTELWNSINTDHDYFKSYEFIKIIEDSHIENSELWYVLFYIENDLIGATVFSKFNVSLDLFLGEKVKQAVKRIRNFLPHFLLIPTLFCGLPISICKDTVLIKNKNYKEEVLQELVKISRIISRESGAKVINFKEFYENDKYGLHSAHPSVTI